jgi:6-hydroxy-3-succinoylpyridine 3-monooxygenase
VLKTIVYVDGFNFYYGCLKGGEYHTVDLVSLFRDCVLPSSSGVHSELIKLHYYAAPTHSAVNRLVVQTCENSAVIKVWQMTEKQSDVHLALEFLHDALSGEVQQLVLCASDADVLPAFEMVRLKRPELRLGLVIPCLHGVRKPDNKLHSLVDWCRFVVYPDELAACAS